MSDKLSLVAAPRQTKGTSDQGSSTRSVGMNLARRFNAGIRLLRDENTSLTFPGLSKAGLNSCRRYASKVLVQSFLKFIGHFHRN